jgi:hypothetical protein
VWFVWTRQCTRVVVQPLEAPECARSARHPVSGSVTTRAPDTVVAIVIHRTVVVGSRRKSTTLHCTTALGKGPCQSPRLYKRGRSSNRFPLMGLALFTSLIQLWLGLTSHFHSLFAHS